MYLSRLILNPRSRDVRRDLANCQDLHRTLLRAFPPESGGPAAVRRKHGVLHRLEEHPRTRMPSLLVQSETPPDWSRLPEKYLTPPEDEHQECKNIESLVDTIEQGRQLRFRLRANPTRKVNTKTQPGEGKNNGRREPLRTEQEQIDWMRRKAEAGGFELLSVRASPGVPNLRVIEDRAINAARGKKSNGRRMTFHSVLYEGCLRVVDPKAFRECLRAGIGSAKAYGFGLLSIAPG